MTYHTKTKSIARREGVTLGARLLIQAIRHNKSVQDIAKHTGASRATVYNWFKGGGVTPAYRKTVTKLVELLESASPETPVANETLSDNE